MELEEELLLEELAPPPDEDDELAEDDELDEDAELEEELLLETPEAPPVSCGAVVGPPPKLPAPEPPEPLLHADRVNARTAAGTISRKSAQEGIRSIIGILFTNPVLRTRKDNLIAGRTTRRHSVGRAGNPAICQIPQTGGFASALHSAFANSIKPSLNLAGNLSPNHYIPRPLAVLRNIERTASI